MSVTEMSVAKMSLPKRPWTKRPWPKCPSFFVGLGPHQEKFCILSTSKCVLMHLCVWDQFSVLLVTKFLVLLLSICYIHCGILKLFYVLLCVTLCPFWFCNQLDGEERAGWFAEFVFLVSRNCCVVLPRSAMGLCAVCDCGISWSYSLTIFGRKDIHLNAG